MTSLAKINCKHSTGGLAQSQFLRNSVETSDTEQICISKVDSQYTCIVVKMLLPKLTLQLSSFGQVKNPGKDSFV